VQRKVASPCENCKGKGFYICKLCKANATIDWSPLYDPVAINPCLCPTCDGNRLLYDFSFILLVISQIFLELILGAWSTISFFFLRLVAEKTSSFLSLYMNWMVNTSVVFVSFLSNQTKTYGNKHYIHEWYITKSLCFGGKLKQLKSLICFLEHRLLGMIFEHKTSISLFIQ
jgi:hypothetical protein